MNFPAAPEWENFIYEKILLNTHTYIYVYLYVYISIYV